MSVNWNPVAEDVTSVRAWLAAWEPCVQKVDFLPARALFDDTVASFGTQMDVVEGKRALERNQWRSVWPTIDDFKWDFDGMKIGVSPDRLMAFLITTWTSIGFKEDGSTYDRPGRTTVILSRGETKQDWLGIHTHFSLYPNTPQRSHGSRPAKS
ncbi:MAG: ketosteroid isomerase [Rhodospirillaceae bacterium]|nr:ketosteroid isomerase [Rhodospirillaceae bacterium]